MQPWPKCNLAFGEVSVIQTRLRVKQAFDAKQVSTRRREKFDTGELLMVVASPESPDLTRFVRINGLRPSRGVECQYTLEPEEFLQKTEPFRVA